MNHLAIVHHANQFIITDGYDNRDGLATILDGYDTVLKMHQHYDVPANLHLSGTLLEAIAWQRPAFLDRVCELVEAGVISLVGGTYSENVMPRFSPAFNRAQILEAFHLYEVLLGCSPTALLGFWVPERVWDPALVDVITDASLPNGGYRCVLLDDRLLFAPGAERRTFDATGPYFERDASATFEPGCRPYRIANELTMLPISAQLRYRVPPRSTRDLEWIEEALQQINDGVILYADDLEKAAGVGGWANDVADFERFLKWLSNQRDLLPIHLDEVADAKESRTVGAGTFYELSRDWGAGEDYSAWEAGRPWGPYRKHLLRAKTAIDSEEWDGVDRRLLGLARKHLLASTHETAWHDETDGHRSPAPWVRAIAGHVRAVYPILLAARSIAVTEKPAAYHADVDDDGCEEVVLCVPGAVCVLSPTYGGRVIYLFTGTPDGGLMSIGNPTDHFNFQEELNKFMDVPPNHPGALVDVGGEHARHEVTALRTSGDLAIVELTRNRLRKTVALSSEPPGLVVCYNGGGRVEMCLSPDYLRLLRAGRRGLLMRRGECWREVCTDNSSVWVVIPEDEAEWTAPRAPEAGHGVNVAVRPLKHHWHLAIGWGPVEDDIAADLLSTADLVHG